MFGLQPLPPSPVKSALSDPQMELFSCPPPAVAHVAPPFVSVELEVDAAGTDMHPEQKNQITKRLWPIDGFVIFETIRSIFLPLFLSYM